MLVQWEKLNMERLAAYNRGELGPEDVLRDGQKPIVDNPDEGPTTAEVRIQTFAPYLQLDLCLIDSV